MAPPKSLRARATEIARDLILENNDAPASTEALLTLCYVRAYADGLAAASDIVLNHRDDSVARGVARV